MEFVVTTDFIQEYAKGYVELPTDDFPETGKMLFIQASSQDDSIFLNASSSGIQLSSKMKSSESHDYRNVDVETGGEIIVDRMVFTKYVLSLPKDENVNIFTDEEDEPTQLIMGCGKNLLSLDIIKTAFSVKPLEDMENMTEIKVYVDSFNYHTKRAQISVKRSEDSGAIDIFTTYHFSLLSNEQSSNTELVIETTDDHIATREKVKLINKITDDLAGENKVEFILEQTSVEFLRNLPTKFGVNNIMVIYLSSVDATNKNIVVKLNEFVVKISQVNAEFPNLDNLMDVPANTVDFRIKNSSAMLDALKRIDLVGGIQHVDSDVVFTATPDGNVQLTSNTEKGEVSQDVSDLVVLEDGNHFEYSIRFMTKTSQLLSQIGVLADNCILQVMPGLKPYRLFQKDSDATEIVGTPMRMAMTSSYDGTNK